MIKVDIFSGFLGAGKTTLIKKLIREAYDGEKLVLIENEFGEIGIDGGFLQEAGIQVTEMNSGCICCSLTGDFRAALAEVAERFHPDRILIEPSGVGKLSDVAAAVRAVPGGLLEINALGVVVDALRCRMYMKNFGEFFNDQVESAGCIILSRTGGLAREKVEQCVELLREKNPGAALITTPWEDLSGGQILAALERRDTLQAALDALCREEEEPECGCEHHHEHHHEHEHEHHHEHEHEHGHEHGHEHEYEECGCEHHHEHEGCGHHHHHHGHDADEVFVSWGVETARKFTGSQLREILEKLGQEEAFGTVLRAKGIVDAQEGPWYHFDYTPGEIDIRRGPAGVTGRLCVIGAHLNRDAVAALFR